MNTVLSVKDAVKSFGGTKAVAGATFDLQEAEWIALLGPNGAGKTTLVRSIAGRVQLDSGRIMLLGKDLTNSPVQALEARARLGIVPQEIALYLKLTAGENLRCFGKLSGLSGPALKERIEW